MISQDEALTAAKAFAVKAHQEAGPAHDFSHVERVYALAERIAQAEGADLFTVRMAALLHDVGRSVESERSETGPDRHEEESVKLSEPFLEGIGLEPQQIKRILEAILRHRHRRAREPVSLEDKCLFDADKLDSLGAVGVARAYLWLGEYGRSVYYPPESYTAIDPANNSVEVDSAQREFHIKLRHLKDRMHTATGKRIAQERHARMERILSEIEAEVRGES
jgi:uncharacterized protein